MNEREYFKKWIDSFAKQVSLPPMAFGGYGERKLDHGVMIVYLLQPEWWDYLEYLELERKGEVEKKDLDW